MVPLFLGPLIIMFAAYKTKSACAVCDSKRTWNYKCPDCKRPICGDCGHDVGDTSYNDWPIAGAARYCAIDFKKFNANLTWMKAAIDKSESVTTFPASYKGKILNSPKLGKKIQTNIYRKKSDAERALKIMAAMEKCTQVSEVVFNKGYGEDGNYQYGTWQASGTI